MPSASISSIASTSITSVSPGSTVTLAGVVLGLVITGASDSSLSKIIPVGDCSKMVAFSALLRLNKTVSSSSKSKSPITTTLITWLVSPGAKVIVPLLLTKSSPVMAVPSAVEKLTVTVSLLGSERVTINSKLLLPSSPSST